MSRIGIYAGSFNPVHTGHIAFALQALDAARLDKVIFLPERRPRYKKDVEHFGHRTAMLKRALWPYPEFEVLELVDISLSIERTLPQLKQRFKADELVFLMGSDVLPAVVHWQHAERLLKDAGFVVALRHDHRPAQLMSALAEWPVPPKDLIIFDSFAPEVSSGDVREALRKHRSTSGLLKSVERYSNRHWLYVSLA